MGRGSAHEALVGGLDRRAFLRRTGALAVMLSAWPLARVAKAAPSPTDAILQAFADTMVPGRKATTTDLGNEIDPRAIAGVDPLPGAVEADAGALYHHPEIGFDALSGPFLADLETRSAGVGGDFLSLGWDQRVQVCLGGLSFDNPLREVWEAAAAIPFTAFCAAALIGPPQTAQKASGYRVMGLPGAAPAGYQTDFSYGVKLARERTATGSLP